MKTRTINVYTFGELSETAKKRAREWYRQGNGDGGAWDALQEGAKEIGLKICNLDPHRANSGSFEWDALEVAEEIISNHGEGCETHKTALRYLPQLKKENDENDSETRENTEQEFLSDLLEDYRIMLVKHLEHENSDEVVEENITINEYEFDEKGNRI